MMDIFPSPRPSQRIGLVVEDRPDTRRWLAAMLKTAFPEIAVREASSLSAARICLGEMRGQHGSGKPDDIALVDIGLPDGSGIDLIREIVASHPTLSPIVTTIYDDDQHLYEAIAAGAQGYLLKDQHEETMVRYLHRIDMGEPPLSPSVAQRIMAHFARRPPEPVADPVALTPREQEVLALIGKGLRIPEAARVLGLTAHTVAGYVKSIYRKLNVSSRAEAAVEAVRRGIV
nr:response regulator transcription factor [Methylobacterium sp. ZNC0032]